MIYLESKSLLFFKSRKTASTSIEIAVSTNANENDIVTPVSMADEILRLSKYGVSPRNWSVSKEIEIEYIKTFAALIAQTEENSAARIELINEIKREKQPRFRQSRHYFNHIQPHIVKQRFDPEIYDKITKVTATRHPYEQLVSHAYFKKTTSKFKAARSKLAVPERSLNDQIEHLLSIPSPNNVYYFDREGRPICDIYIRFEKLESDLKALEEKFGLSLLRNLPLTKNLQRQDRRPASEILTEDQKHRCYDRCKAEFEFFGYAP